MRPDYVLDLKTPWLPGLAFRGPSSRVGYRTEAEAYSAARREIDRCARTHGSTGSVDFRIITRRKAAQ